jgi:hypothetical protein
MNTNHFDNLTKTLSMGTRRGLLRLGAALPLVGLLAALLGEESAAERPIDRVQRRTPQRNRKQRNTQNNSQNNGNGNNSGGGGGGGGGGNGGGGNDNTNNNNGNTLGSGAPCGSGPACSSGAVCLSGDCFTTCPGPFSCLAGSGGCPQPFAACEQTTSGISVCITLTTNVPCTTDAGCGLGAVCIKNPPDPSCQGNLPAYCAVNS